MADNIRVDCESCREALSARLDGESDPGEAAQIDGHAAHCLPCREWITAATRLTRQIRVRPAVPTPDLTAAILAARPAPRAPGRTGSGQVWRVLLGVAGLAQLALGMSQLIGAGPHHEGVGHLFNESTAWNIALGIGFAIAAALPRLAGGLLPTLGVFFLVLAGVSVMDVINGQVEVGRLSSHLLVACGLVLLLLVHRRAEQESGPRDRRSLTDRTRYSPMDAMPEGRHAA